MVDNFENACEAAKTLQNASKTRYKQSTIGDINISQPWADDVQNRAKWNSWNK